MFNLLYIYHIQKVSRPHAVYYKTSSLNFVILHPFFSPFDASLFAATVWYRCAYLTFFSYLSRFSHPSSGNEKMNDTNAITMHDTEPGYGRNSEMTAKMKPERIHNIPMILII